MTQHNRFTQLPRRALRRWGVVSAGAVAAAALVTGSPAAAWAAGSATPNPHSGASSNCQQEENEGQHGNHDKDREHKNNGHHQNGHDNGREHENKGEHEHGGKYGGGQARSLAQPSTGQEANEGYAAEGADAGDEGQGNDYRSVPGAGPAYAAIAKYTAGLAQPYGAAESEAAAEPRQEARHEDQNRHQDEARHEDENGDEEKGRDEDEQKPRTGSVTLDEAVEIAECEVGGEAISAELEDECEEEDEAQKNEEQEHKREDHKRKDDFRKDNHRKEPQQRTRDNNKDREHKDRQHKDQENKDRDHKSWGDKDREHKESRPEEPKKQVWDVDVKRGDEVFEVLIDPETGCVLSVTEETV